VEHYNDSELLVKQLNGQYRVKAGNLKPLFGKVSTLSKKFGSVTTMSAGLTSDWQRLMGW